VSLVIPPARAGYALGGISRDSPTDNTPNGTYERGNGEGHEKKGGISDLHPIRSLCQDVNHKLLVLRCPSSHISICVYDRLDIILDVLLLSSLLV